MSTPRDLFPDLYPNYKPKSAKSTNTSNTNGTTVERKEAPTPMQILWCETQWANLSLQGIHLGLPTLPYFDPKTMLLSKEVNMKLWKQLEMLYSSLGPNIAALAQPKMLEGGEVVWHSFSNDDKGDKVEIFEEAKYRGWSDTTTK